MDSKIVFVRTKKGDDEINGITSYLYGDVKRVLVLIDEQSTVKELRKRAAPSLRVEMDTLFQELLTGGFLQNKNAVSNSASPHISNPVKISNPKPGVPKESDEPSLDFTGLVTAPIPSIATPLETTSTNAAQKALKARLEDQHKEEKKRAAAAVALLKAEQDATARLRAAHEAEAARLEAKQEAARVKAAAHEAEMARIKIEAEMKARAAQEAEQAEQKAREAERARIQTEAALARTRMAEEAQARAQLETEQAAARAMQEARAAAEAARLKAEQEAARVKAAAHEAEMARIKIEAEMKARAAQEAEQAKQKAREAEKVKIQTEAALARTRMAEEAQARAQLKAEQTAAREIQEARAAAKEEAKAKVAAEVKLQAEEQSKKNRVEAGGVSSGVEPSSATDRLRQDKEDGQTQKLVEAQAKVWSEAEQRTKAQTQVAQVQQAAIPPVQRVPRSPRKPLPVVKVSLMLIILLVSAIFLLPHVLPMEEYIKQAELTLSTQLKRPVRIGAMRANLLPMPTLELQNVELGNPIRTQVESVVLKFNLLTVFSPVKEIAKVEINNVVINANFFSKAMPLFAAAGRDALYPVQRMVLQGVNIKGFAPQGDNELPPTNGVLDFNSQGELVKVVLNTENKIISVQLQPVEKSGQGNWKFGLLLRDGHLPFLPEILFTELNVGGLVSLSEANINEIEGFLYGGKLTGSTRVTWAKGWQMLGQLHLSNLELQEAMPQLGMMGKLGGDANLNFRAGSLAQLIQSPQMNIPRMTGKFVVKKGAINAFDLVDVTSGNATGSGRTHFDEANGTWQVTNDSYQLRQIKIAGGMMSANGSIDLLANKKLSGKLNVALQAREEMGNVPVLLSGTLDKPELQVVVN